MTRSTIILGCGRSGTSLVAGLLHESGAWQFNPDLLDPSGLNPKGFFESRTINGVNEKLLAQHTRNYSPTFRRLPFYERLGSHRYRDGQRWLAALSSPKNFT